MCNDGIRTVSRPKYSINAQTPSASKETFFLPVLFDISVTLCDFGPQLGLLNIEKK